MTNKESEEIILGMWEYITNTSLGCFKYSTGANVSLCDIMTTTEQLQCYNDFKNALMMHDNEYAIRCKQDKDFKTAMVKRYYKYCLDYIWSDIKNRVDITTGIVIVHDSIERGKVAKRITR